MSFADDFLEDHDPRTWVTPSGQAQDGLRARHYFLGRGEHALEVAVAEAESRPKADDVRALWHGETASTAQPSASCSRVPAGSP